jgi:putative membrane protein
VRILSWIAGLILAAIVVVFALSNRQPVLVGFWPFVEGLSMPLYLAVLLPLLIGLLLGWLVAAVRAVKRRLADKKAAS